MTTQVQRDTIDVFDRKADRIKTKIRQLQAKIDAEYEALDSTRRAQNRYVAKLQGITL